MQKNNGFLTTYTTGITLFALTGSKIKYSDFSSRVVLRVNRFAQEIRLGGTWYLHLRFLQHVLPPTLLPTSYYRGNASRIPVSSFPGYRNEFFTYAAVCSGGAEGLPAGPCGALGVQGQHCRAELAATGAGQWTLYSTEKLCHLEGGEWLCAPLLSLRGVSMPPFLRGKHRFSAFQQKMSMYFPMRGKR